MMANMERLEWTEKQLCRLLNIDDTGDLAEYIVGIEDVGSLSEYLAELLDVSNDEHREFMNYLLDTVAQSAVGGTAYNSTPVDKPAAVMEVTAPFHATKHYGGHSTPTPRGEQDRTPPPRATSSGEKRKTKFVSLYSDSGEAVPGVVTLPGRHECDCQASRHRLINNCLSCGRVVCQQEGSGPCFFCGTLVCTREEREVLDRGSKKSDSLLRKLTSDGKPRPMENSEVAAAEKGLAKALQQKETLLEYDKTSARRTKVIDDQSDYFSSTNKWLSKAEREAAARREKEMAEKKKRSKRDQRLSLDFAGRTVRVNDDRSAMSNTSQDLDEEEASLNRSGNSLPLTVDEDDVKAMSRREIDTILSERDKLNPRLRVQPPTFCAGVISPDSGVGAAVAESGVSGGRCRVQDGLLAQTHDQGLCLSMHQPWASLLTSGIKLHEGRVWYTPHRGRLWIASTARQPTPGEIKEVEDVYRARCDKEDALHFPTQYPAGCLLGFVELAECVAAEEYAEAFPGGESDSPYVFICEQPQELLIKFPIKGKHKIFPLDGKIHQAAKKSIEKQMQMAASES